MHSLEIKNLAEFLLEENSISKKMTSIIPLEGGANNRVFKIETEETSYLLKHYYSDPHRNRAVTDFQFCSFAWNHQIQEVPRPIGTSSQKQVALYEFIQGRRLTSTEITSQHLAQAANFFVKLNQARTALDASKLALGAEACFSIAEHLDSIEQRIQKLTTISQNQYLGKEALEVTHDLSSHWQHIKKTIKRDQKILSQAEHCLSPSDFGFHNALEQPNGIMRFFDFEYAGWDDPAKMIADFFCQPEVPVSHQHIHEFSQQALKDFKTSEAITKRAQILLPCYQIKWSCILLNEFLPQEASRRQFALTLSKERKQQQLLKAQKMLFHLESYL